MPELPEVETVRQGLAPVVEGAVIEKVLLNRENLRFSFEAGFIQALEGRTIRAVKRRAKYLIFALDDGTGFLAHLGMSGRFLLLADRGAPQQPSIFYYRQNEPLKHDHVYFELAKQAQRVKLIYCDPRRFGFMELIKGDARDHDRLVNLGPEPLGSGLSAAYLLEQMQGSQRSLKALLLDQSLIAGLGNIYVCEALYGARLSPFMTGGQLVDLPDAHAKMETLIDEIQSVLQQAIEAGGSSLSDFAHANGNPGYFQHHFNVYDQAGEVCGNKGCGNRIVRVTQHQRASFYCPSCQRF